MNPELVCSGTFYGSLPFYKYRIPSTGLSLTIFHHDGPLISADILLKTLTDTEEGLPHTLEHLVFMGSDKYPKGFLDFAANRCLSEGTNAWTDQDHTNYTVRCAGQEGFLAFLPIFLDHILFPVLTPETFTTEVYHLNGKGEDGGVVYCEMQSYESTMANIAERSFAKSLFGQTTPYSVETGGILHDLRTTCTFEKCRDFHRENYRPDNMNIIVFGKVAIEDLCKAILPIHNKLLKTEYPDRTATISPVTPIPREKMEEVRVEFPAPADDDPGCILLGMRSKELTDLRGSIAEDAVLAYLTDTPASPLTKALVHAPEPFCSSVSSTRYHYPTNVVQLELCDTDVSRHAAIKELIFSTLEEVVKSGLDVKRLRSILENKVLAQKLEIENRRAEQVVNHAFLDHLYGGGYLEHAAKVEDLYYSLIEEEPQFWVEVLSEFAKSCLVCVFAEPSETLLERSEEEDEERVEKRREELGGEKLEELGRLLEKAELFNKPQIPESLFEELAHPNKQEFTRLDTSTLYTDHPNLPPSLHFHSIETSFLSFTFLIDTDRYSVQEKSLVELLVGAFCSLPVKDPSEGGVSLTADEVAAQLEELFLEHRWDRAALFSEQIKFEFTFKPENLERCLEFLRSVFFHQVAEESRVSEYITNLLSEVKARKRDGSDTLYALIDQTLYPFSTTARSSLFCQEQTLSSVSVEEASTRLQGMLSELLTSDCSLHVVGSRDHLDSLKPDLITEMFGLGRTTTPNFVPLKSFLGAGVSSLMAEDIVVKVPGEESSYCVSVIPLQDLETWGALDIRFRVFTEWFAQLDGVVGLEVRGKGLAYGFYTRASAIAGCLSSYLLASTDINGAYSAVQEVLGRIEGGEGDLITERDVDLARSAAFFTVIQGLSSPRGQVAREIKQIHSKRERVSVAHISESFDKVTRDELVELCKTYHCQLYRKGEAVTIYAIPQNKDVDE